MAVSYGLLVILGLIPATSTLFGLVPIYGMDVWLHLALGAIAAYFGFMAAAEGSRQAGVDCKVSCRAGIITAVPPARRADASG